MNLADMIGALDDLTVVGDPDVEIRRVDYDSRQVQAGSLFCCLRGQNVDGHRFAPGAVADGATGLLVDHTLELDAAQVLVTDTRIAMPRLAAAVSGHPSADLAVVGVTGTNGKTTVTHLVAQLLDGLGRPTGVIGTLQGARTTPEAPDVQRRLREFADDGTRVVAMEVSSHALVLHRVDEIDFAVGVFTNLSQDHLDFHGTMEEYFAAKRRFFEHGRCRVAVINVDGTHGRRLADELGEETITYSMASIGDPSFDAAGTTFTWRGHRVRLPLVGSFNALNAVAAAEAVVALGHGATDVARSLGSVTPVPGRFEAVGGSQSFDVIVDYAHTPEGLTQVLATASAIATARVIVVFGCGGDRDRKKRRPMGVAAAAGADLVIITSDNPRSETPESIIASVVAGAESVDPQAPRARLQIEPDRRRAISSALSAAGPGDVVVIAGKGHETTQVIGDTVIDFDDRVEAQLVLGEMDAR